MLKILIVEDEVLLAQTLRHLLELNPRYQVTGIAADLDGAIAAIDARRPDIALVDLKLARGQTGFTVAVRLRERDIPVFFTSGNTPSFPVPDLALGCISKPYNLEDLSRAMSAAEDILRGRDSVRRLPEAVELYAPSNDDAVSMPAFIADEPAPKPRMFRWFGS